LIANLVVTEKSQLPILWQSKIFGHHNVGDRIFLVTNRVMTKKI
jgi:hypothetical protein